MAFSAVVLSLASPLVVPPTASDAGAREAASIRHISPIVGDWPRQDFDVHNDSFNRYETAISSANVADLEVSWSAPLDSGPDARAGPIVIGGTVYVGTHSRVFAFDSASGTERWEFAVGRNTLVTGIAHWKNLIFATDVDQHAIFALDAATGEEVWTLSSQVGTTGPTVIGNKLLFNDFGILRAVHPATGNPIWTAQLGETSFSFPARPPAQSTWAGRPAERSTPSTSTPGLCCGPSVAGGDR